MKTISGKTAWSLSRWHRESQKDKQKETEVTSNDPKETYGRLRLVVSNRDVEQKVCLIEECAEFTRERVFQKKASKNLEIDKEIYKNLI